MSKAVLYALGGVASFLTVLFVIGAPDEVGRVSAFVAATTGDFRYTDSGDDSRKSGTYPGTECSIYVPSETETVTDTHPSVFDLWGNGYAFGYNKFLAGHYPESITTRCGTEHSPYFKAEDQVH
jgi:hypothetical protein